VVFGPQPRSYVSALNKKERKAALLAALSDKFQNGSVTLLATDGLVLNKTKEFATLLFGSPKAAKSGVRTLVVFAESELATIGESLARTGNNVVNAAVTHTGALDIKDIVGYTRLVLTTGANDALIARFGKTEKSA
jgi:large subunit ribosomal protein L4